jgi:hypothetical protein
MRPVLLFLLGSISVFAQPFSAGIKAGVPLNDFLNAAGNGTFDYTAPTQRYIVGGMAEVRLPLGLGVEFDALYRKLGYNGSGIVGSDHHQREREQLGVSPAAEIPFPFSRGAAVLGRGCVLPELKQNTTMGFVIGGGIDIHAAFLHISPELRFTRWNSAQINDDNGLLHSNLNQAEFLVGFTF